MSHLYSAKRPSWLITLLVSSVISGCASLTTPLDDPTVDPRPEAECTQPESADATIDTTTQGTGAEEPAATWPRPVCPKAKPCPVCAAAIVANKPVLGEYELVTVAPPGFKYLSRIDTGATSTAIHATDITRFERDGQKWVRFDLTNPDDQQTVSLERRLIRRIRIKQTEDFLDRRLIVMMNLQLGKIERQVEVSLTDRSKMEFPLLIGRNFLLDTAVVDVSLRRTVK